MNFAAFTLPFVILAAPSAPSAAAPKNTHQTDRIVCRRMTSGDSMIPRTICRPATDWEAAAARSEGEFQALKDKQRSFRSNAQLTSNP